MPRSGVEDTISCRPHRGHAPGQAPQSLSSTTPNPTRTHGSTRCGCTAPDGSVAHYVLTLVALPHTATDPTSTGNHRRPPALTPPSSLARTELSWARSHRRAKRRPHIDVLPGRPSRHRPSPRPARTPDRRRRTTSASIAQRPRRVRPQLRYQVSALTARDHPARPGATLATTPSH